MVMKILLVKPACSGRSTDIALESSESRSSYVYKINDTQFLEGGGGGVINHHSKIPGYFPDYV